MVNSSGRRIEFKYRWAGCFGRAWFFILISKPGPKGPDLYWRLSMIRRIALLHTVVFLADMFRKLFQEKLPGIESFHMVDEGIIQKLMEAGGLTPWIVRRIASQVGLAADTGADLILFTCSSTSPAVDTVRPMVNIPIVKIDDPLAEKAVNLGSKIGVVTTVKSTVKPSVDLIQSYATKMGKKVRVQSKLETDAFQARLGGDIKKHDRIVKNSIMKLAVESDVIVLAQASMAHLAEEMKPRLDIPILASPLLCIESLKSMVEI